MQTIFSNPENLNIMRIMGTHNAICKRATSKK